MKKRSVYPGPPRDAAKTSWRAGNHGGGRL